MLFHGVFFKQNMVIRDHTVLLWRGSIR